MTRDQLIESERKLYDAFEMGDLPFLVHMSGGNEDELIRIFGYVQSGDYVFASHRSHYHYLLKGGDERQLHQMVRDGRSMFVFDRKLNFLTSSILAGTCGIAAGVALAFKLRGELRHVWCFLGDGAEDEGHFYEAARFVESMDLPCTFIIEDNDRSVDTSRADRGSTASLIGFKCVHRYSYVPTYPHGGTGTKTWVKFNPQIVNQHAGKR